MNNMKKRAKTEFEIANTLSTKHLMLGKRVPVASKEVPVASRGVGVASNGVPVASRQVRMRYEYNPGKGFLPRIALRRHYKHDKIPVLEVIFAL